MEGVKERPAFQVASGQLVIDGGTVHDRLSTMNLIRSDKMIQNQYAQECGRNTKKKSSRRQVHAVSTCDRQQQRCER